jgi:23S rRNA pseudouridine1911/1915/1917 synthase
VTYGASGERAGAVGLHRPFLHALHLHLAHPRTGAPLDVEAPLPDDLAATLVAVGIDPAQATRDRVDWPPPG